jgi:hypothetical protein
MATWKDTVSGQYMTFLLNNSFDSHMHAVIFQTSLLSTLQHSEHAPHNRPPELCCTKSALELIGRGQDVQVWLQVLLL